MGRRLRIIASLLVLFCGAAQAAALEPAAPQQAVSVGDALCEAEPAEGTVLDEDQQRQCRALRQARIEETRRRNRERVRQVIEENRQRRALEASLPPPPPPPVTVETFMEAGSLFYGDVVVTDRGPRVFIGKPLEAATLEDFVAIDSPRSPHRARATQFDGAFPERKTARPPPPRQQRQP
ncbi:hypothetical protein [Bosea vaviloviae]|uniref:hypothetical protein n=1 Tax=Bosea vaviloviae TaxID=1526658 RepID=UPI000AB3DBA2|nr:hypothetical protein [Bosea vaviloviae]